MVVVVVEGVIGVVVVVVVVCVVGVVFVGVVVVVGDFVLGEYFLFWKAVKGVLCFGAVVGLYFGAVIVVGFVFGVYFLVWKTVKGVLYFDAVRVGGFIEVVIGILEVVSGVILDGVVWGGVEDDFEVEVGASVVADGVDDVEDLVVLKFGLYALDVDV